jgi:hypothetical protein
MGTGGRWSELFSDAGCSREVIVINGRCQLREERPQRVVTEVIIEGRPVSYVLADTGDLGIADD